MIKKYNFRCFLNILSLRFDVVNIGKFPIFKISLIRVRQFCTKIIYNMMRDEFKGITPEEYQNLTDAIAEITILIAGADGTVHKKDRKSTRLNSSHVAISYA